MRSPVSHWSIVSICMWSGPCNSTFLPEGVTSQSMHANPSSSQTDILSCAASYAELILHCNPERVVMHCCKSPLLNSIHYQPLNIMTNGKLTPQPQWVSRKMNHGYKWHECKDRAQVLSPGPESCFPKLLCESSPASTTSSSMRLCTLSLIVNTTSAAQQPSHYRTEPL